jgi:hypothetical protein
VIKPAPGGETAIEGTLASMAERRVAQVVGQRQRLRQILIKPKRASQGTGNLGNLQRMGQARAEMIPFVENEDLVLYASRRNAVAWMIRSQSRRKALRVGLTGSGWSRPRLRPGADA